MDVTPGPQLRRRITKLQELTDRFNSEQSEVSSNPDLPDPDWMSWAQHFDAEIRAVLPLVRS